MQEYITNGTIITQVLGIREVEAGTVCLVQIDNNYYRVTITHINAKTGEWIVEGDYNGPLDSNRLLQRLCALTENQCIPIAFKDWGDIISAQLIGIPNQNFLIKPKKFKPGKNVQTCSNCYSTFLADKNQPYCKQCCSKLAVAELHGDSKKQAAGRRFTLKQTFSISASAFKLGKSKETFNHADFNSIVNDILYGNNSDTTQAQ